MKVCDSCGRYYLFGINAFSFNFCSRGCIRDVLDDKYHFRNELTALQINALEKSLKPILSFRFIIEYVIFFFSIIGYSILILFILGLFI